MVLVVIAVEKLEEDPLRPLEVFRIGRVHLAVPVVAETEHLDLPLEGGDVLRRRLGRMRAGLNGVLLGGQAERVPAHRVEDVEAAHPLVAREDVGGGVAFRMADVQARPARIREHVEDVKLGTGDRRRRTGGRPVVGAEGFVRLPVALPLRLNEVERVLFARRCHNRNRRGLYRQRPERRKLPACGFRFIWQRAIPVVTGGISSAGSRRKRCRSPGWW